MTFYGFARGVVKTVLTPLYRVKVYGRENFPETGGVLLCSNHISELDPPVVGISAPRPVHFIAKEELFNLPVLKMILPRVNAIPIKRGMSDRNANTGMLVFQMIELGISIAFRLQFDRFRHGSTWLSVILYKNDTKIRQSIECLCIPDF